MRLIIIALCVSGLLAGPVAAFAPLGMAPLAGFTVAVPFIQLIRLRLRLAIFAHPSLWGVLPLLAWMLASSVWALDRPHAWSLWVRAAILIFGAIVLCIVAATSLSAGNRQRVGRFVLAGFCLLVLFVTFELISGGAIVRTAMPNKYSSVVWTYVAVSRGSIVMALMLWPAMLSWRTLGRCSGAVVASFVIVAIAAVCVLTEHDATRAAVAAGIVTFAGVYASGRMMILALGIIFTAFVLSAPLLPYGPLAPELCLSSSFPFKPSVGHRLYIWQFVAERIWERPWLGWGLGSSRYIPGADTPTPVGGVLLSLHPHNAALQVWLELGVVGALLAAVLVATLTVRILRMEGDRFAQAAAAATLAAAFVAANLSFGIWQNWWLGSLGLVGVWLATSSSAPMQQAASGGPA